MNSDNYYQSRHFRKLLKRYEDAMSNGNTPYLEADELTDIAEFYMSGHEDAKATQAIQVALDIHPDSVDPQIFLARQKMFYGQLEEARAIVNAITEQDDCEVIYLRAELLIKEGHPDEASDLLADVIGTIQDNLDTFLYDCTAIFMDYDQWQLADEWAARLRQAYPAYPKLPLMEAEIRMGLDDYEGAAPELQKILDDEPYNAEAWNLLAETYVALEKCPEAIEAADYALAIDPEDSNAHLMKGNALMRDEQMEEAAKQFEQYLKKQPDDVGAQISLAICYNASQRHADALVLLERMEKHTSAQPDKQQDMQQIYMMRAYTLSRLGRLDDAAAAMDLAEPLVAEDARWQFHIAKADVYLQCKRPAEAEELFALGLSESPEKSETLFNIALAYSNACCYDNAIDLFFDVWTLYGMEEGKFVVPFIANCYRQKGDTDNYLKFLKHAAESNREATERIFRHLFPGAQPEDYYIYAYRIAHGSFPKDKDQSPS